MNKPITKNTLLAYLCLLVSVSPSQAVVSSQNPNSYHINASELKKILDDGMAELGFKQYLDSDIQGHIITSFLYPSDPNFNFERFYQKLNDRGFIIYPGKLSKADAFRIGNIGQIFPGDVKDLITAIREVLEEEKVNVGVEQ